MIHFYFLENFILFDTMSLRNKIILEIFLLMNLGSRWLNKLKQGSKAHDIDLFIKSELEKNYPVEIKKNLQFYFRFVLRHGAFYEGIGGAVNFVLFII